MENFLVVFLSLILATYFCGKIYIFLWHKITKDNNSIPSGFGFILPLAPIALAALNIGVWKESIFDFWIIFCAGAIYLIDDLKGLSPWIRILIAFLFGGLLFWSVLPANDDTLGLLLLVFLFGIISVILTNVINFYDGDDLNIASLIILTGLILVYFSDIDSLIFKNIGWVLIAFSLGFGAINRVPSTLYFGDAGCFVLALLFLYFLSHYNFALIKAPEELIAILALPFFDVFYVMLIRIYYKHDVLSRNYLHLYQRIRIRFGSFFYILPQVVNVLIILFFSYWINFNGMNKIWEILILCSFITPIFYLLCRFFFVKKSYFFGDGRIR